MKAASSLGSMPMGGHGSLFIGDLPKFCQEEHIEHLFAAFGTVLDVKIKRSVNETRTITYSFVTMSTMEAAENAKSRLDGQVFMGRILRVNWAFQHTKGGDKGSINSIYVRYSTPITDRTITNQDLLQVFVPFGYIEDVSIKESFIDHRGGSQYGYGFVHFSSSKEGVQAAFQAVKSVHKTTLSHITFTAELSRNLLKQFEQQQQQQQMLQGGRLSSVSRDSCPSPAAYGFGMASTSGEFGFTPRQSIQPDYNMHGRFPPPLLQGFMSQSHDSADYTQMTPNYADRCSSLSSSMPASPHSDAYAQQHEYDQYGRYARAVPPLPPRYQPDSQGSLAKASPGSTTGSSGPSSGPSSGGTGGHFFNHGMMRSTSPSSGARQNHYFTFEGLSRVNSNCSDTSQVTTGSNTPYAAPLNVPSYDATEALRSRLASFSFDGNACDSPPASSPSIRPRTLDAQGGIALKQWGQPADFPTAFAPSRANHGHVSMRPPMQQMMSQSPLSQPLPMGRIPLAPVVPDEYYTYNARPVALPSQQQYQQQQQQQQQYQQQYQSHQQLHQQQYQHHNAFEERGMHAPPAQNMQYLPPAQQILVNPGTTTAMLPVAPMLDSSSDEQAVPAFGGPGTGNGHQQHPHQQPAHSSGQYQQC